MSSKFYEEEIDLTTLRFGDLLQGFIETVPHIENPLTDSFLKDYKYHIESLIPEFSVIMTPCCSIGENTISLAPLKRITSDLYRNLSNEVINNFTILNFEVESKKIISPFNWNFLSKEQKAEKEAEGKAWVFIDRFFYKGCNLFEEYEILVRKEPFFVRDYVIDFKEIYQIKCNKIIYQKIDNDILSSKCLELTIEARDEFRKKIANYYGRVPDEDLI